MICNMCERHLEELLVWVALMAWCWATTQAYVIHSIQRTEPKAITCWTCPNTTDPTTCDQRGPKTLCPNNYTICQSIHRVNTRTGMNSLVNKRCALPSECGIDHVGCHNTNTPGIQECVSCCNSPLCNDPSPAESHSGKTDYKHSSSTGKASEISSSISSIHWSIVLFVQIVIRTRIA